MEVYKSETREVIRRYQGRHLSFPECIAALDSALAGLVPSVTWEELPELRAQMLANREMVGKEPSRRETP